jgi:hypothetical protein
MNIADWLAAACADADKRGLSELKPMLESLARSTTALRLADAGAEAEARTNNAPLTDDEG